MRSIYLVLCTMCLGTLVMAQNRNISSGDLFDGEPYLVVNPDDPKHLVVAWMGWQFLQRIVIKTRVSKDGGETWGETASLPHTVTGYTSADPSLAFDADGNVFAAYIDFTGRDVPNPDGGIYVCKSVDGGYTWKDPVLVRHASSDPEKLAIDRPWMVIDRSQSAWRHTIYITSMNAKGATPPFHPYIHISRNGGNSFEPWQQLDGQDWLSGSLIPQPMPTPAVTTDGLFHAIYPSWVLSQQLEPQFILASSSNGGQSFDYQTVFSSSSSTVSDSLAKKGYLLIADPSDPSHLAFLTLSMLFGDPDIVLYESFDSGIVWEKAIRVNDDPVGNDRMQDLVWADFNQQGDLVVSWRDRRNGTNAGYATASETWAAVKRSGEVEFAPNFRLSDTTVSYDPVLAGAGNDFMCTRLVEERIYSVWGDPRGGFLNIWFQISDLEGTVSTRQILSDGPPEIKISPNPVEDLVRIEAEEMLSITVFDPTGRPIWHHDFPLTLRFYELDTPSSWHPGMYQVLVQTRKGAFSQVMLKM